MNNNTISKLWVVAAIVFMISQTVILLPNIALLVEGAILGNIRQ